MRTEGLRIAPGTGLIVRRQYDLLFLPQADAELVDAFIGAPVGTGLETVTDVAEQRDFAIGAFVGIDWSEGIRIVLFGDVEVTSDHRSMPRLSAAGSGTWIERTVRADIVRIAAGIDGVDELTDLQRGTVSAGGFAALLNADIARTAMPTPATPSPIVSPGESSGERSAGPPVEPVIEPSVVAPAVEPVPAVDPDRSAERLSLGPPPRPPVGPADEVARALLGVPADVIDQVGSRDDPTIDMPDELIALIGATESPHGAPTGGWRLRFADGLVEPVDRPLLLGRKHADEPGVRSVVIDCAQMSARHLLVRVDGGGLWVTDLRSRNRSWVVTSGDHQLVPLEPDEATRLDHGTHVQVGSKVFVVEQIALDSPASEQP